MNVMNTCSTCSVFIRAKECREDIKAELSTLGLGGYCGDTKKCNFFTPLIANPELATCGSYVKEQ